MNEFEKESATMDMKEEMMSDAVDDVMDDEAEGEGEEEEGDKVLREVLDEIGVSMGQMVSQRHLVSARIAALTLIFSSARHLIMPCPRHPHYPTDKLSQKASARTLDHQVVQPASQRQVHQRAVVVVAPDYRMKMRCRRGWTSCAGTERSWGSWYSLSTVVYVVTEMEDFDSIHRQHEYPMVQNAISSLLSFPEMYMISSSSFLSYFFLGVIQKRSVSF
jgi:hypothetical protein